MDATAANKVAAVIIASFDKKSNRPLLLSLAIFVAENPGCRTADVASHFCPNRVHGSARKRNSELTTMRRELDRLAKIGVLTKDYETIFVPAHSRKSVGSGPNCHVKDAVVTWSLRKEFAQ